MAKGRQQDRERVRQSPVTEGALKSITQCIYSDDHKRNTPFAIALH